MIYYSVNNYNSVFAGIKNIQYHWIPEYHAHYWPIYKHIEISNADITKKFLCLNKRATFSRWLTYKKFYTDNLLEQSIFSFLGEDERWGEFESKSIIEGFEITIQNYFTQFKNLQTPNQMFCKIENDDDLSTYLNNYRLTGRTVDPSWILNNDYYQQTFCSVIAETSLDADKPNFSEKTFRAICHGHPFILIGSQHSLQFLRELGFDTYDDVFDNTYDHVADPWSRLLAVFDTIDQINHKPIEELDNLKKELYVRRLKNRDTYQKLYNKLLSKTDNLLKELNQYVQSKI